MKSTSLAFALLLQIVATVTATDYCAQKCNHIACGNNGALGPKCPAGQTNVLPISAATRDKILDSHNQKRQQLASGQLASFKSAERMGTMQWDEELAQLALLNVKTCVFAHDSCHSTDKFKWSGQNLGILWYKGFQIPDDKAMLDRIEDWWNEYKNTKQSDLDKYPTSTSKTIGHFTVMAADRNIAVGCAGIHYIENGWDTVYFACNYATTNIIGYPMYKSGSAGSKCSTGRNWRYPALCSTSEKYDL